MNGRTLLLILLTSIAVGLAYLKYAAPRRTYIRPSESPMSLPTTSPLINSDQNVESETPSENSNKSATSSATPTTSK
jgi:hypothetical protein